MWVFLGQLLSLVRDKRWGVIVGTVALLGTASLAYAGKLYVDQKHAAGVKAVEQAEKQAEENKKKLVKLAENQTEIVSTLKVMQNTLQNANGLIEDVKHTVRETDKSVRATQQKVVEIYEDVYQIKLKQSGG